MRFNIDEWKPKTKIGEMVKAKEITSIEQIFESGKVIKEVEIVDALIPNIEDNVIEIASVQRMTKNNRKQKYRATVIIGDKNGHVGIGVGKDVEVKPSIETAIRDAKKHIISVNIGCGSWECNCGTRHSIPMTLKAKCGSSNVILKPAPKGVGIVAAKTIKAVLELAGIKDVWTFARGRTRDKYNAALATYDALKSLSEIKNVDALAVKERGKQD
ncbi:MAG: 30S ribosomal protein S5 [Candidatus Micrarchaeota archaeon]|nr:30S ribosomal protein S5 [Candidatus Micrarchaeota archaeon]